MNYHAAKKHAPSTSKQLTVWSSCEKEFPSYYSLQQHRRKKHGTKQRKPSDKVADLNKIGGGRGKWRGTQRGIMCLSTISGGY